MGAGSDRQASLGSGFRVQGAEFGVQGLIQCFLQISLVLNINLCVDKDTPKVSLIRVLQGALSPRAVAWGLRFTRFEVWVLGVRILGFQRSTVSGLCGVDFSGFWAQGAGRGFRIWCLEFRVSED